MQYEIHPIETLRCQLEMSSMNDEKKSSYFSNMLGDFLYGLVSCVLFVIALVVSGYDIGEHGLPSWSFFPIALIFIFLRFVRRKKK